MGAKLRKIFGLEHTADGEGGGGGVGEFFGADVEGVEGVGAVGAVFEEGFFGLGEFFGGFVFAEAEAASGDAGGLDGQDEVVVVLAVEEGHEALLAAEGLVDQQVFLVVAHGVSEVDVLHAPAVALEFVDDHPTEILVVDGVVGTQGGGVVVEHHRLVAVVGVVGSEVVDHGRYLAFVFGKEGFYDVEPSALGLAGDDPVDVGVVVHANADGGVGVDVRVGAAVEGGESRTEVRVGNRTGAREGGTITPGGAVAT